MVLMPTAESKLLASCHGPYEIVEATGEVDYKVRQPDHQRPEQIYHVNLLKPWRDRETCLVIQGAPLQTDDPQGQVRISPELTPEQRTEVIDTIQRNQDVFCTQPVRTTLVQQHLVTSPGVRVTIRPYRIPEAKREEIRTKVKLKPELWVIEESHSQWSSPIVLVPKPDGTLRFCNDFWKLNEVSQFDAYPISCIDELVDQLGKDLTKGYWQIPLAKDAKEKTAFSTPDGGQCIGTGPFGLHGAPATFQRLMDKLLRLHAKYAAAYLDDSHP
ncbi:unnamed protein product [Lepidochelys kempii]